ncbi:hypothetical protein PXH69_24175 [Rhodococcus qingshengii]|uniref:Uncharacterized protein n=1 Tax=Rhodococcus qingshengii TaxID=334542 RepID=A0AAW6LVP6_RHOSG|nr:hypothetical protein [Rhodococcus qingshengii]MDE8648080.1 hypothetical protein [Rhodococcus qingshengii]
MAIERQRARFVYYNEKPGSPWPVNPAIKHILRSPQMREYMRDVAFEGQMIFQAMARKGSRPNAQRNSQMVRTTTRLWAVQWEGAYRTLPDRWMAEVQAYAPHALAREFGYRPWGGDPKNREKRDHSKKRTDREKRSTRQKAEATLGGNRRKKASVVGTLERKYYKK